MRGYCWSTAGHGGKCAFDHDVVNLNDPSACNRYSVTFERLDVPLILPPCAGCGKPCDVSDVHAGVVCRNPECPRAKEDGTCPI